MTIICVTFPVKIVSKIIKVHLLALLNFFVHMLSTSCLVFGINYDRIELLYAFPIVWLAYAISMFELRKRSSIVDIVARVVSSWLYDVIQHILFFIDFLFLLLLLIKGGWFFIVIAIYIFGFILNPVFGIRGITKAKR